MIVYINRDNVGKNLVPRSAIILPVCGIPLVRFLGGQHGLTLSRRFDCWWTAGKKLSITVEALGVVI